MKKIVLAMASVVLVLGAAGCSSDYSTGLLGSGVSGSYNLQTFNGSNLPALFERTVASERDLVAETFTIYSDGTYTDDYRMRTIDANGSSDQTFRDTGTYQQSNTALSFRDNASLSSFTGSITGNTLTITQFNDIYVFSR